MPTTALTITSSWQKVADGPASVLIPGRGRFYYAVTAGPTPAISLSLCPTIEDGEELSCELIDAESLYVAADQQFQTSVTSDA